MNDTVEEFRSRGAAIFRSLKPKRDEKTPKKKKSGGSKSIFSSLMLANIEQQMQFDPTGNYLSDYASEDRKNALQEKVRQSLNGVPKNLKNDSLSQITEDEVSTSSDEEISDSPDEETVSEILLDIDPYIFEVYEDVLYIILYNMKENDIDNDLPSINKHSAYNYVKDAFQVSDPKHNEIFEKVKSRESPEIVVETEIAAAAADNVDAFCFVTPKIDELDAFKAHCCLTKILLNHELQTSNTPHYFWMGKFSLLASTILQLHSEFRYLTETNLAFTKWLAFADIQANHPLDLNVFFGIYELIAQEYKNEQKPVAMVSLLSAPRAFLPSCFGMPPVFSQSKSSRVEKPDYVQLKTKDEKIVDSFWKASEYLTKVFLTFIENLNEENDLEFIKVELLRKSFMIVKKFLKIEDTKTSQAGLEDSVKKAIANGTSKYLQKKLNKKILRRKNNEARLAELIRMMEIINADYMKTSERFGFIFEEFFSFSYGEILYKSFDGEIAKIIRPVAVEISNTKDGNIDTFAESGDSHSIAKKLFELFMKLKTFSDKGMEFHYSDNDFETKNYFSWFSAGIDKFCKVSVFTALTRIEKAVAIDKLKPISGESKHSSSSVDVLSVLYSVKQFWEDLEYPNHEDASIIACNVSGDICRFAVTYIDLITDRAEKLEDIQNHGIHNIPFEVYVVISNINFCSRGIEKLILELAKEKTTDNDRLLKTISNALSHGTSRITKVIQSATNKMMPSIRKLMLEGAEIVKNGTEVGDRLLVYIDDSLSTLHSDLDQKDFYIAKTILWKTILIVFSEVIQKSLEVQRPPYFYSNLRTILNMLQDVFNHSNVEANELSEKEKQIDFMLERYGLNTANLIHQYFKDRYKMQQEISKSPFNPFGVLSIHCYFMNNTLKLEILNAKNLVPIGGSNRKCDSFVKINIVPEGAFPTFQSYKTEVERDTHFPLYEELFEFNLTTEQRNMKDAIIFFNIKDRQMFGSNQCVAEAFLSFSDVPEFCYDQKIMKQIHLTLTRLQNEDIESLKALQLRSQAGDKMAKEFLAKVKGKIVSSPVKTKSPVMKLES